MGKLIELLNEWANQMMPGWSEYYEKGGNIYLKFKAPLSGEGKIENEVICSKRYEFIKWLVENDKIDRVQKTKEFRLQIELDDGSYGELGGEARLLMLLSISDTPIEDLIGYLK